MIAPTSMKDRHYAVWLPIEKDRGELTVVVRTLRPPQMVLPAIRRTGMVVIISIPSTIRVPVAQTCHREDLLMSPRAKAAILLLAVCSTALADILVVHASEEELAEHEAVLKQLDKAVKGSCIWRSTAAALWRVESQTRHGWTVNDTLSRWCR